MNILFAPALVSAGLCTPQDEPVVTAPSVTLTANDVEGADVRTEVSIALDLELVESRSTQNGEDVPAEMMPSIERMTSESSSVVIVDAIGDVADGVAVRWTRTFEEIEGTSQFDFSMEGAEEFGEEPVSETKEIDTTLSGASLEFTREDDEVKVEVADGSSVDEDDMHDLEADTSFAFLLPDAAIEEGDTWKVDPSGLERLLHLTEDVAGVRPGGFNHVADEVEPEHRGDFELAYSGTVDHGGRTLTVIELTVDVTSEMTFEPEFELMVEGGDDDIEEIAPDETTSTTTFAATGAGKLLWDAKAGHLVELNLNLDLTVTTEQSMSFDVPEMGPMDMTQTDIDEGTAKVSVVRSIEN